MNKEFIEAQREMNREALGFAHAYVQVLVAVGYAAIFFLWDKAADRLPPTLWSGVGLLLCISVGTYLAWELFAFLFRQHVLMRQAALIGKPGEEIDPDKYTTESKKFLEDLRNFLPKLRVVWYPVMLGIILPLALTWAVVLVAFAVDLLRAICC